MPKTTMMLGDCLERMRDIADGSIDAVICDPPYGTTKCKWDQVIPFDLMWAELLRITKENAAILLFGGQPFSSTLITSNLKMFRYQWMWKKDKAANWMFGNRMPLKIFEDINVFYRKQPTYNPQKKD